jgi:hypothetical protein
LGRMSCIVVAIRAETSAAIVGEYVEANTALLRFVLLSRRNSVVVLRS